MIPLSIYILSNNKVTKILILLYAINKENHMSDLHYISLEQKLSEVLNLINLLLPETFTLSYISNTTGVKRDTLNKFLQRNYLEGMDYKKKDGKIIISREVGLELLRRYKNA
jgi:hypothetical protein